MELNKPLTLGSLFDGSPPHAQFHFLYTRNNQNKIG